MVIKNNKIYLRVKQAADRYLSTGDSVCNAIKKAVVETGIPGKERIRLKRVLSFLPSVEYVIISPERKEFFRAVIERRHLESL